MAELAQVWKTLFGREIGDDGLPANRKVVRFSVNVPCWVRESAPPDEEYEEELGKMMRFIQLCPECRENVQAGADAQDLDERCSELWRTRDQNRGGRE